jgi:hypothetical protein
MKVTYPELACGVDGGKRYCGWGIAEKAKIVNAGFINPEAWINNCGLLCGHAILRANIDRFCPTGKPTKFCNVYAGESPDHRGDRERANYNANIRPIVHTVSMIAGVICDEGSEVHLPTPLEWKGNEDGDIYQMKVVERLTLDEKRLLASIKKERGYTKWQMEQVLDGVGITLWVLGRMNRYLHK